MSVDSRLRELVIDQLGVDGEEITNDASFTEDLGADSLDCVELVMGVEEEFKIEIDDEVAEDLDTYGKLLAHIEGKVK